MADGMTYLAVAYLGMLISIGIWTWTVFSRSNDLEQRITAVERHSHKSEPRSVVFLNPSSDEQE
jgi:hypothetical protein